MFHRVLVALDGTREARRSLRWVRLLAPDSHVRLLMVLEPVPLTSPAGMVPSAAPAAIWIEQERAARDYLGRLARRLGGKVEFDVRLGSPADGIARAAQEFRCDLAVLTPHGGSPLLRRTLGGTTEQFLHASPLPLLAVPAGAPAPARDRRVHALAVPLDGGPEAELVLPLALALARKLHAGLCLIHAVPTSPMGEVRRREADALRRIRTLARGLRADGTAVRVLRARGEVPQTVCEALARAQADLLVMCVHGHGALEHLLHGALASRILQAVRVPALVVRHDAVGAPPSFEAGTRRPGE